MSTERVWLDAAESREKAWQLAQVYVSKMHKHNIKGRMISVEHHARRHWNIWLTMRPPQVPVQRHSPENDPQGNQ